MNNEGFISSLHVFDLLIHDLIKPRKFNCVTVVSRGISSALRGDPQNLPNSPRNLSNFAAENCGPYSLVAWQKGKVTAIRRKDKNDVSFPKGNSVAYYIVPTAMLACVAYSLHQTIRH